MPPLGSERMPVAHGPSVLSVQNLDVKRPKLMRSPSAHSMLKRLPCVWHARVSGMQPGKLSNGCYDQAQPS